jgi:membrane complex biogenesis BtpA family protein
MSELLEAIAAGRKPMIGMIQLRPLAGSSRYRDGAIDDVLAPALADAAILRDAGFDALMVQNLGDLPVARSVAPVQVAWMTRIAAEIRRAVDLPLGLNFLENDAEAMFAVATAVPIDFVRVKVYVGAVATPAGIEAGQAFEAMRARTSWRADRVAIFADVHDRTGVPVASAGLPDDLRATFAIGGADGVVLTGRTHGETLDFVATARTEVPGRPILVGGGASPETIGDLVPVVDGAIVSSALKSGGLFGRLDAAKARAFIARADAERGR